MDEEMMNAQQGGTDSPVGLLGYEPRKATHREKLTAKRQRLSAQLQAVDAAIAALDAHPDLEDFMKVIGNAGI